MTDGPYETRAEASEPERIQLSRKGGSKLPAGAKSVARPSFWGNPFKVGALVEDPESDQFPPLPHLGSLAPGTGGVGTLSGTSYIFTVRRVADRADAVALFIAWSGFNRDEASGLTYAELARRDLAGRALACWCPLDGEPCHADALLDLAAGRRTRTPGVSLDGRRRIHVKRYCNGCGESLGDVADAEIACAIDGRPLPDVRRECPRCAPGLGAS